MEFLFKRDNTGEKNSAEGMGKQQNEQPFKASTAAQITRRNNPGPEGHSKDSADFSFSEIVIFSRDILFFHNMIYRFFYEAPGLSPPLLAIMNTVVP